MHALVRWPVEWSLAVRAVNALGEVSGEGRCLVDYGPGGGCGVARMSGVVADEEGLKQVRAEYFSVRHCQAGPLPQSWLAWIRSEEAGDEEADDEGGRDRVEAVVSATISSAEMTISSAEIGAPSAAALEEVGATQRITGWQIRQLITLTLTAADSLRVHLNFDRMAQVAEGGQAGGGQVVEGRQVGGGKGRSFVFFSERLKAATGGAPSITFSAAVLEAISPEIGKVRVGRREAMARHYPPHIRR